MTPVTIGRGFGSTTLDCATFDQSYAGDISDLTLSEVDLLKVGWWCLFWRSGGTPKNRLKFKQKGLMLDISFWLRHIHILHLLYVITLNGGYVNCIQYIYIYKYIYEDVSGWCMAKSWVNELVDISREQKGRNLIGCFWGLARYVVFFQRGFGNAADQNGFKKCFCARRQDNQLETTWLKMTCDAYYYYKCLKNVLGFWKDYCKASYVEIVPT